MGNFEALPLKDIHLPDPVSWWPPAIGWWLLLTALLLAGIGVWVWLRHSATRRHRKRLFNLAEREINRIETEYQAAQNSHIALQQLSVLMRRVSLSVCDRNRIAGLYGVRWTNWLADSMGAESARTGPMRQLVDGPYNPAASGELSALFACCRIWLRSITGNNTEPRSALPEFEETALSSESGSG